MNNVGNTILEMRSTSRPRCIRSSCENESEFSHDVDASMLVLAVLSSSPKLHCWKIEFISFVHFHFQNSYRRTLQFSGTAPIFSFTFFCFVTALFGMALSPRMMFTKQISISDMNTKIVLVDINVSTVFKYDTGGSDACDLACWVDRVSSDVTPSDKRAAIASGFTQNDIHCRWQK